MSPQYVIVRADDGFRWQLFSREKRLLAVSAAAYPTTADCQRAIESLKSSWSADVQVDPLSQRS